GRGEVRSGSPPPLPLPHSFPLSMRRHGERRGGPPGAEADRTGPHPYPLHRSAMEREKEDASPSTSTLSPSPCASMERVRVRSGPAPPSSPPPPFPPLHAQAWRGSG